MKNKYKFFFIVLLLLNFFTFPLISNIAGILLPLWKENFNLNNTLVSSLAATTFLASGLTSIPQGMLLGKIGNKWALVFGSSLILIGSSIFGFFPRYEVGIFALFIIGAGITALNMGASLLVKKIDENPNKYSGNLTIAQTFCSLGSASGGIFLSLLMKQFGFDWKSIYLVFSALSIFIILFCFAIPFPETPEEKMAVKSAPLKNTYVI